MKDKWSRSINYIRISVTNRCNLRCNYCVPKEGIPVTDCAEELRIEEIEKIAGAGVKIGIDRIKITGGEPLMRKDLPEVIDRIKRIPGISQVTMTTNGVMLYDFLEPLVRAGVDCINVNIPSMDPFIYKEVTGRDELDKVLKSVRAALRAGVKIRINCVGRNDLTEAELTSFLAFAKENPVDIRFIEMMPIGLGSHYEVRPNDEIRKKLEVLSGNTLRISEYKGNGPAVYYEIEDYKGKIGFISAISHKFCESCNRVRINAKGDLKLCLNFERGVSLKEAAQGTIEDLAAIMQKAIYEKPEAHSFHEESNELKEIKERKNMVEIGG